MGNHIKDNPRGYHVETKYSTGFNRMGLFCKWQPIPAIFVGSVEKKDGFVKDKPTLDTYFQSLESIVGCYTFIREIADRKGGHTITYRCEAHPDSDAARGIAPYIESWVHYRVSPLAVQERESVICNLRYDKLGKLVLRKLNERFKGVPNIEYFQKFKKDQPITHSNVPRILAINQILREEGLDIHVLSPEEVVRYRDTIPERGTTYANTNSVVIYPKEGSNEDLRQKALQLIGKSSTEVPLVVSGLGVERADNNLGFTFTQTGNILVREAPYLTEDGYVIYDPVKECLVKSDQGVRVWVPRNLRDQSGLRGLYRNSSDVLVYNDDELLYSSNIDRVQLFSSLDI